MTDYQKGRVAATHLTGTKVEDLKETYAKEASSFEAMKVALALAGKSIEMYLLELDKDVKLARIPIKEAEYGKRYVTKCVEIVKMLYNETEAKRLQAVGAAEAMKQAIDSIKRLYDDEKIKLDTHTEWENDPEKDAIDRPVGANPADVPDVTVRKNKKRKGTQTPKGDT